MLCVCPDQLVLECLFSWVCTRALFVQTILVIQFVKSFFSLNVLQARACRVYLTIASHRFVYCSQCLLCMNPENSMRIQDSFNVREFHRQVGCTNVIFQQRLFPGIPFWSTTLHSVALPPVLYQTTCNLTRLVNFAKASQLHNIFIVDCLLYQTVKK